LNAVLPNGRFTSKWPHVEWRFGSLGSYPDALASLPVDSVVCVNPPFTEAYLADVMMRLAELKLRFRLRFVVPIQDEPWRKKLQKALPSAQVFHSFYDASADCPADLCHPTLLWEDPRCPPRPEVGKLEAYYKKASDFPHKVMESDPNWKNPGSGVCNGSGHTPHVMPEYAMAAVAG